MKKYKSSRELYGDSTSLINSSGDLLEIILADAKPVVSSTMNVEYDLKARPTELSSGGYVDCPGE